MLRIHTDGSCHGNGTPHALSGCGVWFGKDDLRNTSVLLPVPPHTNQRAELFAVLLALRAGLAQDQSVRGGSVEVISDSAYCVNGVSQWLPKWKARSWRKADGTPVANVDLWRKVWATCQTLRARGIAPRLVWTKGHAGNHAADDLASRAVASAMTSSADSVQSSAAPSTAPRARSCDTPSSDVASPRST